MDHQEQVRPSSPEPSPITQIALLSEYLAHNWFKNTSDRVQEWSDNSLSWHVSIHHA